MPISDIFECLPESLRTQIEAHVKTDDELNVIFDMNPDIAVAILVRRGMGQAPVKPGSDYTINQVQLMAYQRALTLGAQIPHNASIPASIPTTIVTPSTPEVEPAEEEVAMPPWRDTNPGPNQDAQMFTRGAEMTAIKSPYAGELMTAWTVMRNNHVSWNLYKVFGDVSTEDGGTKRVYGWAFWTNLHSVGAALNAAVRSGKPVLPTGWFVENLTDIGRGFAVVSRFSEA